MPRSDGSPNESPGTDPHCPTVSAGAGTATTNCSSPLGVVGSVRTPVVSLVAAGVALGAALAAVAAVAPGAGALATGAERAQPSAPIAPAVSASALREGLRIHSLRRTCRPWDVRLPRRSPCPPRLP